MQKPNFCSFLCSWVLSIGSWFDFGPDGHGDLRTFEPIRSRSQRSHDGLYYGEGGDGRFGGFCGGLLKLPIIPNFF